MMRLLGLVSALLVLAAFAPPAASAQPPGCRQPPPPGIDLPGNFGVHPLITQLGLEAAWDLSRGEGVLVAVIDSGVDWRHPKLAGAVEPGVQFEIASFPAEFEVRPGVPLDCEAHGTGVAGLIAARRDGDGRVAGVAPAARIFPVRVPEIGSSTPGAVAAAITSAVDSGARVINMSLATRVDRPEIRAAVEHALRRDVVVVAAAGNEGESGVAMYPAAYDGVIAVASVDEAGQPVDQSNSGAWVDIAAYGQELVMLAPGGHGYLQNSGTSFAAAQVSGTAALLRAEFPGMPADQVRQRLLGSAVAVGGGRNDRTGAGLVDPFFALTATDAQLRQEHRGGIGRVAIGPVPREEPLLSPGGVVAATWSGVLLIGAALALCAVPVVRRASGRAWRAGPVERPRHEHRTRTPPKTELD